MYTLLHHYPMWEECLSSDPDKEYLLDVILNGLWISQHGQPVRPFSVPNYLSVKGNQSALQRNLAPELKAGRVVQVDTIQFDNAVGLIPKGGSTEMRRITDLSRPRGGSINESVPDRHFKFQNIDHAMSMMSQGCYMAIIDIRHAYRHILIRPKDWDLQSFRVGNQSFQDRCLSFGLKIAPEVFTRFTQAILRILHSQGCTKSMAYLDEFFLVGDLDQVWRNFAVLIQLLGKLGFYIHWGKIVAPVQVTKFLGFLLDSKLMKVRVPPDKMADAAMLIQQALTAWLPLKRWERLLGKLNFIARAIYGGRTFLRRVIDLTVQIKRQGKRGARVSKAAAADLRWWSLFMDQWNGEALILDGHKITTKLATDASNYAVGAVFRNQVVFQELTPQQKKWHINVKELYAFLVAIREWGASLSRKHIKFIPKLHAQLDSTTALAWINKGSSKNKTAMLLLRELFWRSATQHFRVTCSHIPGVLNTVADAASRLEFHRIPGHLQVKQARALSAQELAWMQRLSTI